ncbi:MAG TPA: histidine kinase dimerization/phospho-acceptor domain-containing protein [Myxococcaceae bacterium]|nr:histidine kinase dimerization/phospho-acceptor domain-containing protein [Myxococcaceae bacterium]
MFEPEMYAQLDESLRRARHDLKTPLAVMKGYLDMMLRGMGGELTPQMRRYLERMGQAVRHELTLLDSRLGSPEGLMATDDEANQDRTLPTEELRGPGSH